MTDLISRRTILASLAVTAAFLPGPRSRATAQSPRRRLYAQILNQAIATGDVRGVVDRQRRGLDKREIEVFYSLTREDLATLGSFRGRMAKLGVMEVAR